MRRMNVKLLRTLLLIVSAFSLAALAGCGSQEQPPQNAQEARAKFLSHPAEKDLSPQARAVVEAMRKQSGGSPPPGTRQ